MEYKERVIDLIDLMWKILFAWRYVIVVALGCAILLPGFMYFKNLKSYDDAITKQEQAASMRTLSKEEQIESLTKDLSPDAKAAVEVAVMSKKDYEDALNYVNTSPIMQIDPYNEEAQIIEYYLDSGYVQNMNGVNKESYTESLFVEYKSLVNDGTLVNALVETGDVPYTASQLRETVSASNSGNIITVKITTPDKNVRTKVAEAVKETINNNIETINQTVGTHSITLTDEYQTSRVNTDLITKQKEAKARVTTAKTQVDSATKSMTEEQKNAVNSILKLDGYEKAQVGNTTKANTTSSNASTNGNATAGTNNEQTLVKPSFSFKYALVGLLLGIFIVAGIIAIKEVLNGNLKYDTELKDIFGVDTLSIFTKEKTYKGIDAWLYKLSYKNKRKMTREEAMHRLIVKLGLLLKDNGSSKIYITGTKLESFDETLRNDITTGLNDVSIEFGNNVCLDEESLIKADDIGIVLVVEQLNNSSLKDISEELSTFREHEIDVIGGVVYE